MKEYVDAAEFGKRVKMSEQMINYYRRTGVLKGFMIGKHYRYNLEEELARLQKGQNN